MQKKIRMIFFCAMLLHGFWAWEKAGAAVPSPCTGSEITDVCTKSGTIYTCPNATSACIQDAVTDAAAGDTINVTATGDVTWPADAVNIPADKPLNILGPGRDSLTIHLNGNNVFAVNAYIGTILLPATRISGFKFVSPLDAKYYAISVKGQGWRIDHCTYHSIESADSYTAGVFVIASGLNTSVQPHGLIDNNNLINGKILVSGMGNYATMAAAWADDLHLGTAEAVYVEDNTMRSDTTYRKLVIDANRGGKYVFRYNTTSKSWALAHGLQSETERGTRKWEFYGNTFLYAGGGSKVAMQVKGGTGVSFYNDITSLADPWNGAMDLYHERDVAGAAWATAGPCDGNSGFDGNESGGWLCRDQIGADKDAFQWIGPYISNLPGPQQTKTPAYFWSIMEGTTLVQATKINNQAATVLKNRDYYESPASGYAVFDGTSGVGCGALADRPKTCTTGVAYWSTDQSCMDLTGMVGKDPATPISGTLYKCTSENIWSAYYAPYSYPHPLRKEAADVVAPAAPGGLRVQ